MQSKQEIEPHLVESSSHGSGQYSGQNIGKNFAQNFDQSLWRRFGVQNENWDFLKNRKAAFFIFSLQGFSDRAKKIKTLWNEVSTQPCQLFYSMKSNPNLNLLKKIEADLDGFDVSSYLELKSLLDLGVAPSKITFSGPGKTDQALELALTKNIRALHLDSLEEWSYVQAFQKRSQTSTRLTLRVALKKAESSKLGLSYAEIDALLARAPQNSFQGFHLYLGRESFSGDAAEVIFADIRSWREKYAGVFSADFQVYFGAGLPADFGDKIWNKNNLVDFPVHLEAGRVLIAPFGIYGARVSEVYPQSELSMAEVNAGSSEPKAESAMNKQNIFIDGGVQHIGGGLNSPILGYSHLEILTLSAPGDDSQNRSSTPSAVGSVGQVFSSMGRRIYNFVEEVSLVREIKIGDWILFYPAGAYGFTAAPNQFAGATPVDEILYSPESNRFTSIFPKHFHTYYEESLAGDDGKV